ncbi:conserved hypothetical protein [Escherichia coli]|uniref:Uncharacterized protein n=1 Tax=Escherichia coli O45:K1 (strain S88 / ExPEC) TaxID=585035 RepID=B7MN46_ECO45|nr:hypothetical protein ECS88_3282 [Escherichia coli S88]CRL89832.1 conserved hypothetical protein [Escherichia coli]
MDWIYSQCINACLYPYFFTYLWTYLALVPEYCQEYLYYRVGVDPVFLPT